MTIVPWLILAHILNIKMQRKAIPELLPPLTFYDFITLSTEVAALKTLVLV